MTQSPADIEAMEREAQAQLDIIRALKPLDEDGRRRVVKAVSCLIEADDYVPGVLDTFLTGQLFRPPARCGHCGEPLTNADHQCRIAPEQK